MPCALDVRCRGVSRFDACCIDCDGLDEAAACCLSICWLVVCGRIIAGLALGELCAFEI